VFFPREREREKRDVFETRELTFLRLSRNTYRRYMKRVRKMKEQRGEIERERERGKVRSFLRVGIVYLVVVVIFV